MAAAAYLDSAVGKEVKIAIRKKKIEIVFFLFLAIK
jgi:hypothetical protein